MGGILPIPYYLLPMTYELSRHYAGLPSSSPFLRVATVSMAKRYTSNQMQDYQKKMGKLLHWQNVDKSKFLI